MANFGGAFGFSHVRAGVVVLNCTNRVSDMGDGRMGEACSQG